MLQQMLEVIFFSFYDLLLQANNEPVVTWPGLNSPPLFKMTGIKCYFLTEAQTRLHVSL